jgi:hypothetical protein
MGFRPDASILSSGNNVYSGQISNWPYRATPDGGIVVNEFQGKWAEAWRTGLMFYDTCVAAGIVLSGPAVNTGVLAPTLFVPLGGSHTIWLEIVSLDLTYLSAANVPGGFAWFSAGPSSGAATGGTILTLVTAATMTNLSTLVTATTATGAGNIHQAYMGQSTFTASPTLFRSSSVTMFTGVAATAVAPFQLREVYDGSLNIPNGWLFQFCTAQANGTAKFLPGLTVVEHWTV